MGLSDPKCLAAFSSITGFLKCGFGSPFSSVMTQPHENQLVFVLITGVGYNSSYGEILTLLE